MVPLSSSSRTGWVGHSVNLLSSAFQCSVHVLCVGDAHAQRAFTRYKADVVIRCLHTNHISCRKLLRISSTSGPQCPLCPAQCAGARGTAVPLSAVLADVHEWRERLNQQLQQRKLLALPFVVSILILKLEVGWVQDITWCLHLLVKHYLT